MRTLSRRLGWIAGLVGLTGALALTAAAQVPATQNEIAARLAAFELPAPRQDAVPTPAAYVGNDWLTNHYRERTIIFSDYQPLNGGVAFVGDSITEGGDWAALFPGVATRNYGIGGDRAEGLLVRYGQVVDATPGRILLLIGTNDLANGQTPAAIADNVGQLLALWQTALPDTPVVVQSVLPRQAEFDARVRDLNTRLQATAAGHGAAYVDIHTAFVVQGDRLDPAVTEDDLHLTAPGYARWAALIDGCVREGACG